MIFVYIFIVGVPALLVFISIKKMIKARIIRQQGIKTVGVVASIKLWRFNKGAVDKLLLAYRDCNGREYFANATTSPGKYKRSDVLKISYLKDNPGEYVIEGMQQGQWVGLIFFVLMLAFMIFASCKIDEMVQAGNYQFNP